MSETQRPQSPPIGKLLFDAGAVTREQVTEALEIQRREGGKTFEILIRLGYLDKEILHGVLSRQPGIASIDLDRFKVSRELLGIIPKDMALRELVLPIDQLGRLLTVAMACPLDGETIARIEQLTSLKVKALLCKYDDIAAAVEKYYPTSQEASGQMPTFELSSKHGGAGAAIPQRNLTEEIKRLESLAVAPGVLDKLLEVTKNTQSTDLKAAMQIAASDPALAGWLLAVANSPAYGLSAQVDSLGLAVALLGADGIQGAVAQLKKDAPQPKADFALAYDTARKASLAAALLAKKTGKVDRGVGYTAALLRRIGWFALATVAPADMQSIEIAADEPQRCEEERKRMGLSHLEAGAIIANRWRLPECLLNAVSQPAVGNAATTPLVAVAVLSMVGAERGPQSESACFSGLDAQLAELSLDANAAYAEVKKVLES